MGRQTFCCRLLMRRDPDKRKSGSGISNVIGEKSADVYCVNLDRKTHFCRILEKWNSSAMEFAANSCSIIDNAKMVGLTMVP